MIGCSHGKLFQVTVAGGSHQEALVNHSQSVPSGMCFEKYVKRRIKAVHDADVKGFLLWNARQDYTIALKAVTDFYELRKNGEKNAL